MAVINDTIDQLSYEIGEASGYIDGSKLGYEYDYHDCVLDLKREKIRFVGERLNVWQRVYILRNRNCGEWHCCSSLF